jgi:hypothetical protein
MGFGLVNELICYVYKIAVNVAKVGGTELVHCLGGFWRVPPSCHQHYAPMGGREELPI